MKPHETILKFIPEGDKTYNLGKIKCRLDAHPASLVPTDKRLMICRSRWWGLSNEVDDIGWGKFDHVKVSASFGRYSIELRMRGGRGTLKLEKFDRENFEAFYRRIQERISKYDEKYKLSSKLCPQCGEIINNLAKQCPHCLNPFQSAAQ